MVYKLSYSFITTVFNEEDSVLGFLDSVTKQSEKPDEIIVVDGGSSDNTVKAIREFSKSNSKLNIKLLVKKGNIASGRNEAIKKSKGDVILCSDVGCNLDKDWVRSISEPFEDKSIDVVAGFYEPQANNIFEKSLATYTCVMPDKLDKDNFLPSSRSVAFRKSAWRKVDGYPEWLDTCEDLYFARELKRKGFKFKFQKNAKVYWPQRKNLKEAFIQFYRYAVGDGVARYVRPNTPLLFARYIIGFLLLLSAFWFQLPILFYFAVFLLVGYMIWAIVKNYKYVIDLKAYMYLPLLQFTSDIAVLFGMSIGFVKGFSVKKPRV